MNERELDLIGRRAATAVRHQAERIADSSAELASLLAEVSEPAIAREATPDVELDQPPRARGSWARWRPLAVASVAVAVIGVGAFVVTRDRGESISTSSEPSLVPATTTAPGSTTPPPPTTTPATVVPVSGVTPVLPAGTPVVPSTGPAAPSPVGTDPLAGWSPPTFAAPSLDTVPRLLPSQVMPGIVTTTRSDYEYEGVPPTYSELWVRARADASVDAVVELTTRFDGAVETGTPIEVEGWPDAWVATAPEVVVLVVSSPSGSVTVWTAGIARDEVVRIASELVRDTDGVGWAADTLSAPTWVLVDASWYHGVAARTLIGEDTTGSTVFELTAASGLPAAQLGPIHWGGTMALTDVGGQPALTYASDGLSAVKWSPTEGVAVVVGSRGPLDTLLATARSLTEVDQATWEAASIERSSADDGCYSLFC